MNFREDIPEKALKRHQQPQKLKEESLKKKGTKWFLRSSTVC